MQATTGATLAGRCRGCHWMQLLSLGFSAHWAFFHDQGHFLLCNMCNARLPQRIPIQVGVRDLGC